MKRFKLAVASTLAIATSILYHGQASAFVLAPTLAKWGSQTYGTPANVTWSIMNNGISCAAEFTGCTNTLITNLNAGFTAQIQQALDQWSSVANINFAQVSDNGLPFNNPNANFGNIRFGAHVIDGKLSVLAHAYYPRTDGQTMAGDVHFDNSETWRVNSLDGNFNTFDIFYVAMHEIGHSIGLAHSTNPNSVMAPYYSESKNSLQSDDIAGARYIYGPRSPSMPNCNLPTAGGSVHLDLVSGDGCLYMGPSSTLSNIFADSLNSSQKWNWQTQLKNLSATNTISFVGGWYFPNGGSPVVRRITLPPNQIFGISIAVQDRPPETGSWRYSFRNGLSYALGLDTSVSEWPAVRAGGPILFDSDTIDQDFVDEDFVPPDYIYSFSDPDGIIVEDTTDPPDVFFYSEVPGPLPIAGVAALLGWRRRLRARIVLAKLNGDASSCLN